MIITHKDNTIYLRWRDENGNRLEKEVTDLGLDLSEIQKASQDAWMLVAPTFKLLEGYEQGAIDSGESINASHKRFLSKYALSKAIALNGTPDSQKLIDDLYLGTNWIVNIPGMPGLKRMIPKNIPAVDGSGIAGIYSTLNL